MELRAGVDHIFDERGRMLFSNEPCEEARRPAPRFTIGCAPDGYVTRFGAAMSDADIAELTEMVRTFPRPDALRFDERVLVELRAFLGLEEAGGPIYIFPDRVRSLARAIRLTRSNRELVRDSFPWLFAEVDDWQPCFVIVADRNAVAACYSARSGVHAAEAGVDTLAAHRRRGYASIVSAAWGGAIRDSGRIPFYSTGWDNLASQAVARRLGLRMIGSDATWE